MLLASILTEMRESMLKEYTEKRKLDRFELNAPAWIDVPDANAARKMCKARILNISSGGASVELNDDSIEEDKVIELNVLISVKKLSELFGIDDHVLLKVGGKVLRKNGGTAAVEFERKFDLYSAQQDFVISGSNNAN